MRKFRRVPNGTNEISVKTTWHARRRYGQWFLLATCQMVFEASLRFWECKGSGKRGTYATLPPKFLLLAGGPAYRPCTPGYRMGTGSLCTKALVRTFSMLSRPW